MSPRVRIPKIPPLQSGDRLTRDEFERRYFAMPHVKKAELLDGEVHMPSPVSWEHHGGPHSDIVAWLGVYKASTKGVDVGDNSTVRLDLENEPQPDGVLIVRPENGGRVTFDSDGYLSGSPELVAEVSASSVSIDLNRKFHIYRRNGITEYVVWRIFDEAIDWFILNGERYDRLEPDPADGLLKSRTFPGLWLDPAAMVRRDLAAVLAALALGTASPEHAAFVSRLASAPR